MKKIRISRRKLLKAAAMAGGAMMLPIKWFGRGTAFPYGQSPTNLRKFVKALPGLGPTGIPAAAPMSGIDPVTGLMTDYYTISAGQFTQSFHDDLPDSTLWGYADAVNGLINGKPNRRYLGGAIVAKKGRPVRLTVKNELPSTHPLPIDRTIMGAETGPDNRISVHLHGGLVPWNSDGGPFAWFDPAGNTGASFANGNGTRGQAEYYYPNDQSARLVWYHDHAMGITRLNAYAGLATAYIIRDPIEEFLIKTRVIPSREIPLVIQDKTFVDGTDVDYAWGKKGDLWYPYQYDRWDYGPLVDPPAVLDPSKSKLPVPSIVPEFFSDTIVVNGAVYPYVEVEPRHYRFRILNGSQARFYNLQLYYANTSDSKEADLAKPGPRMIQIGTEGGFLPFPAALNNPPVPFSVQLDVQGNPIASTMRYNLLLGNAERADVIIDFSKCSPGSRLILYNDAPAPFPMGDPLNDYFTNDPDQTGNGGAPPTQPGYGPNTRTLLQFRVGPLVGAADPPSLGYLEKLAVNGASGFGALLGTILPAIEKFDLKQAVKVRDLTLNEDFDEYGRLIQRLGTNVPNGSNNQGIQTWSRDYLDPAGPTETPNAGDLEVWRIFNLTGDTHPIHFHLVNVQVLLRRPFDVANYNGTPAFTGPARLPDRNELGWKETVRMNPGEMTEVAMKFDLPKGNFMKTVPESPRTGGHEYVWHCHILEHEEHDMMRPLIVKP